LRCALDRTLQNRLVEMVAAHHTIVRIEAALAGREYRRGRLARRISVIYGSSMPSTSRYRNNKAARA
jgi:hypothetical protein